MGLGYQGRNLQTFLAELTSAEVRTVADIRLTPMSRVKGFTKRALFTALENAGID